MIHNHLKCIFFSTKNLQPPGVTCVFFQHLQDLLLVFAGKEALDRGFVKPEEVPKNEIFEGTYKNRDPFVVVLL